MNLLLEQTNQIGSIIILGLVVVFLVASPFIMRAKNKKEMNNAQKMMDEIKKGDTVLTASGVIGKVISIETKEGYKTVTIETGNEKHKGYITLDIAAVYANLSNPVVPETTQTQKQEVLEEKQEEVEQPVEVEEKTEQPKNQATNNSKSKKK